MDDLTTPEGVLKFCEERRAEMLARFAEKGRFESESGFSFEAYAFMTHELDGSKTGKKLDAPTAHLCTLPRSLHALPPHLHTVLFGRVLGEFAELTRATGTLLLAETWTVKKHFDTTEQAQASMGTARDEYPDDLADAPGREEQLVAMLEHHELGPRHWYAKIQRGPTRLEPWREETPAKQIGRLANLLQKKSVG
jgi:hypothetical protein